MAAVSTQPDRAPITRAEYEALVRRGAFDDARVELLYGRIVSMSPQGGPHTFSVTRLARLLIQALGEERAVVRVQAPFVAPNESEPEPDVAVVAPGEYIEAHPQTALLLIEVADSSLARDRAKARLYAASVTEYWIVNLVDEVIEVHRGPQGEGYGAVTRHARGEVLRPECFADVEIRVKDVLPSEK